MSKTAKILHKLYNTKYSMCTTLEALLVTVKTVMPYKIYLERTPFAERHINSPNKCMKSNRVRIR